MLVVMVVMVVMVAVIQPHISHNIILDVSPGSLRLGNANGEVGVISSGEAQARGAGPPGRLYPYSSSSGLQHTQDCSERRGASSCAAVVEHHDDLVTINNRRQVNGTKQKQSSETRHYSESVLPSLILPSLTGKDCLGLCALGLEVSRLFFSVY